MNDNKQDRYIVEPGQDVVVDLFRPEDAEGVAACFRTVYGDGYPVKTYYQPDRLIEENAAGRTISSVARTVGGDVVGHNALYNSDPYNNKIYESGAGLVVPEYRTTARLFTRLVAHGEKVGAEKFGVEAIYCEAVCNHVYSQRLAHGLGYITHAAEIDLMPASAYTREKSASGRVTSIFEFKTIKPRPHAVFLPPAYDEFLRFTYSGLDDERNLISSREKLPTGISTRIKAQVFDFARVARIAVLDAGSDFESVFKDEEKAAAKQGVMVFQVWLNLSRPWVGEIVEALRDRGYFLGGLLPRWFDQDGLLMHRIAKRPDWEGIQLQFDRAKKIVQMVREDWERTVSN